MPVLLPVLLPLLLPVQTMLSCASSQDSGTPPLRAPRPIEARGERAKTVVVVVVDTLARRQLSPWQARGWDTTPRLAALMDTSTVLADTQSVRGMTSVAVSSLTSGAWPRVHGVRDNRGWESPWNPILPEMFQAAGYTTLGYAANTCQFIDRGIDERVCTWDIEEPDLPLSQLQRDEALVTQATASIRARDADEPLFLWLHLMNPHDPFEPVAEHYDVLHPDTYEGELDPADDTALDQWTLEGRPLDDEDLRHLEATYASQVVEMDRQLGLLLDTLTEVGRDEDLVLVFTSDHGEELGEHHSYFHHSCSPYQPVLQVATVIHAPGRLPVAWHDTTVSQVDLAPTIADLAGIGWDAYRDGETRVDELRDGALEARPAFFERGLGAAGVVQDGRRYILDVHEGTDECSPYGQGGDQRFPGAYEELYDHAADPLEHENLAEADPAGLAALRETTCTWVLADTWYSEIADETHPLVTACEDALGVTDPEPGGCAAAGAGRGAVGATLGALLALLGLSRRRRG
ncbi:MAG: sulfatase-like hydrolase/transferase [Alphaproteobacteria bacterium]|nr:sulfatase-like hydrolase/transferase [Alphaproteobacteria bacterium]